MAELLRNASGVDRGNAVDEMRAMQREINWLRRQVRVNEPANELKYEIMWQVTTLTVRYSEYFPIPIDGVLDEVVWYLTTPSTATGPTVRSYRDGTQVTTATFGAGNQAERNANVGEQFATGQSMFQFRISSLGDGTAAGLTAVARFR